MTTHVIEGFFAAAVLVDLPGKEVIEQHRVGGRRVIARLRKHFGHVARGRRIPFLGRPVESEVAWHVGLLVAL